MWFLEQLSCPSDSTLKSRCETAWRVPLENSRRSKIASPWKKESRRHSLSLAPQPRRRAAETRGGLNAIGGSLAEEGNARSSSFPLGSAISLFMHYTAASDVTPLFRLFVQLILYWNLIIKIVGKIWFSCFDACVLFINSISNKTKQKIISSCKQSVEGKNIFTVGSESWTFFFHKENHLIYLFQYVAKFRQKKVLSSN